MPLSEAVIVGNGGLDAIVNPKIPRCFSKMGDKRMRDGQYQVKPNIHGMPEEFICLALPIISFWP